MHLKLPDPGGNRRRPRELVQLLCAGGRQIEGGWGDNHGESPDSPPRPPAIVSSAKSVSAQEASMAPGRRGGEVMGANDRGYQACSTE